MTAQVTLNVRPDEYDAIRKLAANCGQQAEDEIGFDDKQWLDGIAELLGAAIAMDLVLNSTPENPVKINVVWSESDWKRPRLEGDGCIFVSSMTGDGPKGKDALKRYVEGSR